MSSFTDSKQGLPGTELLRAGLYHKVKLMTEGHPRLLMKGGKNILGMSKMQLTTFITETACRAHSEMSAGHEEDAMDVMLEVTSLYLRSQIGSTNATYILFLNLSSTTTTSGVRGRPSICAPGVR